MSLPLHSSTAPLSRPSLCARDSATADWLETVRAARLEVAQRLRRHHRHLNRCAATAVAADERERVADLGLRLLRVSLIDHVWLAKRDGDVSEAHRIARMLQTPRNGATS